MQLRVATTTALVTGILLMALWPVVVGPAPRAEAGRPVQVRWGQKALAYFALTSTAWLVTAGLAVAVIRRYRRELAEEHERNLQALVEGSLRDHGSR